MLCSDFFRDFWKKCLGLPPKYFIDFLKDSFQTSALQGLLLRNIKFLQKLLQGRVALESISSNPFFRREHLLSKSREKREFSISLSRLQAFTILPSPTLLVTHLWNPSNSSPKSITYLSLVSSLETPSGFPYLPLQKFLQIFRHKIF